MAQTNENSTVRICEHDLISTKPHCILYNILTFDISGAGRRQYPRSSILSNHGHISSKWHVLLFGKFMPKRFSPVLVLSFS